MSPREAKTMHYFNKHFFMPFLSDMGYIGKVNMFFESNQLINM